MVTFHSGATFAMRYSVATNTWSPSKVNVTYGAFQGVNAVTDPATGIVYLAAGYTNVRTDMSVYDFAKDSMVSSPDPMPAPATTIFQARTYYQNVFSKRRNSILYFGGYDTTFKGLPTQNVMTEFVPATDDDGTLVVIYGGRVAGAYANDLYIFDTVSLTWRAGISGPSRIYTACTIAGDQLLVWGGHDGYGNHVNTDVLIYNINKNIWLSTYTPPPSYIQPTDDKNNGRNPQDKDSSSSSHTGAIAGGVVGGVAVIAAAVLLFVFLKRRHARHSPSLIHSRDDDDDRDRKATPDSNNDAELQNLRDRIQMQQEELDMQRRLLILRQEQQQQQLQLQHQQQLQLEQQQESFYQPYSYQPPTLFTPERPTVYNGEPSLIYTAGPPVSDPYTTINPAYSTDTKITQAGSSSSDQFFVPITPQPSYAAIAPPYQATTAPSLPYTTPVVTAHGADTNRTPVDVNPTAAVTATNQQPTRPVGNPQLGARER
ncbi:hypothetical protein BGX34_010466 [Mortierella sp. NVP85]|nr:hypothetical protein BGX34_010466 [Mortierella sp. NVP85]